MEKDRKRPRAFLYNANRSTTLKAGMRWQAEWKAVLYGSCASPPLSQRESGAAMQDLLTTWTVWRIPECVASVKWTELMVRKGQNNFFKIILQKIGLKRRKMQKKQVDYSNMRWISGGSVVWNGRFAGEKMRWVICLLKRKKMQKNKAGAII